MNPQNIITNILSGRIFKKKAFVEQWPYIVFLALLAIIYIGNRYHAERIYRKTIKLQEKVKEMRAEAITTEAELMFIRKQSEVIKLIKEKGLDLIEATEPPKKIIIKE